MAGGWTGCEGKAFFSSTDCCIFTLPQGRERVYYIFLPVCEGCYLTLIAERVFVLGPAAPELTTLSGKGWLNPLPLCRTLSDIARYSIMAFPRTCELPLMFSLPLCLKANQNNPPSRSPACVRWRSRRAVNHFDL